MKSLLHTAKLLARYGRDRLSYPRGSRLVMGNALVGRLLYSLLRRDVDILTDTSLDKDCPGWRAAASPRRFWSRAASSRDIGIDGGLILAGGGFNRHAGRRPAALGTDAEWSVGCAGFERRRAGQGDRGRRPHQRPRSQRRLLGAGVDPAPARRLAGGVSALRARPRQAGDAGGRRQRPPLRQRSDLLPSVRAGDAGARQVGDPGISHCGRGGVAEIRSRHGAPRRLGHARRPGRRISCRRQTASSNWRND